MQEKKKRTNGVMKPRATVSVVPADVPAICKELQNCQRQRAVYIKSRIMVANRLQAIVAGTMGYSSGLAESERTKFFVEAGKLIKQIAKGEVESPLKALVMTHQTGIDEFDRMKAELDKQMVKLAKQLPVSTWVEKPEQRGFGLLFLAIVIGETGDLSNYANPAKVWKRLGCAPYAFDGQNHMGSTWRFGKEGKLPAAEWEKFGYSPRRRSIAYLIGEGIVKQNGNIGKGDDRFETDRFCADSDETGFNVQNDPESGEAIGDGDTVIGTESSHVGPYRARYDETKALAARNHTDWTRCSKCNGTGKTAKNTKCGNCKGTGIVMARCHKHGMLLATKLLLKNLWIEWNGHPARIVM
jgi:hypothetical protein